MLRAFCLFALVSPISWAACSGAHEQAIVSQFFNASRLRDNTSLDNVATIIFDPRTQGSVTTFSVEAMGPEHREGGVTTKDVTVSAPVRLPDGQTVQKRLVLTLQRTALRGDKEMVGRWVVTGYKYAD
jgi:hypothetical protein